MGRARLVCVLLVCAAAGCALDTGPLREAAEGDDEAGAGSGDSAPEADVPGASEVDPGGEGIGGHKPTPEEPKLPPAVDPGAGDSGSPDPGGHADPGDRPDEGAPDDEPDDEPDDAPAPIECTTGEELEPDDSPSQAQGICGGSVVSGWIGQAGDDDWFVVDLTEGAWLGMETSDGAGGCATDTVLFVYDAAGATSAGTAVGRCEDDPARLACDDDSGSWSCSLLWVQAPAAGRYHVRLVAWNDDSVGPYVLAVAVE